MCGRYVLIASENEVKTTFRISVLEEPLVPNYNAFPTSRMPVITNVQPDVLHLFRWGLIPHWAKDLTIGAKMINARAETLFEKPAFKFPALHQRCLVPANGYFEWYHFNGVKSPFFISCASHQLFAFAGLWSKWNSSTPPQTIYSFTIITVPPVNSIAHLHNRMPLILSPDLYDSWLSATAKPDDIVPMLTTPDMDMEFYPVSNLVNHAANNSPEVIAPL
ncbi:SOS response-associated peptidase [Sphingobacteriales bacterium UPWRP_1]|nr:hypothetical protein BVG80_12880 [Sphingobacteriales bacterium TSM_CSM]PSJ75782.1 SOS response-associated peptidase [Sphingobacteriales bacterium UPWRP_1]